MIVLWILSLAVAFFAGQYVGKNGYAASGAAVLALALAAWEWAGGIVSGIF